jgi:hypothetical protein
LFDHLDEDPEDRSVDRSDLAVLVISQSLLRRIPTEFVPDIPPAPVPSGILRRLTGKAVRGGQAAGVFDGVGELSRVKIPEEAE